MTKSLGDEISRNLYNCQVTGNFPTYLKPDSNSESDGTALIQQVLLGYKGMLIKNANYSTVMLKQLIQFSYSIHEGDRTLKRF